MHPTQMEYNSSRELLDLREYGRNVHKLAAYVAQIEDRDQRSEAARVLVRLMRQLNPTTSNNEESTQRVWDHLHQMTDFELDVDSDFPKPEPEMLNKKPQRLDPTRSKLVFRHYGRNLELLIKRAVELEEDSEERISAIAYIGRLIKTFYSKHKKDSLTDASILKDIHRLSGGKIDFPVEKATELRLFDVPSNNERDNSNNKNNNRRRGRGRRRRR